MLKIAFEAEKNLHYKQAISYFDAAIAIDSSYADSFYHRGICYIYMFQPQKAIADHTKAIALQPNFIAAYQERASIYYVVGEYDLGLKDINFVLQLDPKNKASMDVKALLLEKNKQ